MSDTLYSWVRLTQQCGTLLPGELHAVVGLLEDHQQIHVTRGVVLRNGQRIPRGSYEWV